MIIIIIICNKFIDILFTYYLFIIIYYNYHYTAG